MAAVLTANGINFSDATSLNSLYGIIPQSEDTVFFQASAPTGWVKVLTHNNKALRVVSGTGAGSGGSITFGQAFPTALKPITDPAIPLGPGGLGNTTLSTNQMRIHSHPHNAGINNGSNHLHVYSVHNRINANQPNGGVDEVNFFVTNSGGINASHSHQANKGNSSGGGGHNHAFPTTSAPASFQLDVRVKYIDVIICSFS